MRKVSVWQSLKLMARFQCSGPRCSASYFCQFGRLLILKTLFRSIHHSVIIFTEVILTTGVNLNLNKGHHYFKEVYFSETCKRERRKGDISNFGAILWIHLSDMIFFFDATLHCNSKSFCQELWPLLAWLKGLLNTGFSQMASAPLQGARTCPNPVQTDQVGGGCEVVHFFPLLLLHVLQAGQKELLTCEQVRCTLEKVDRHGYVKTESAMGQGRGSPSVSWICANLGPDEVDKL